MTSCAYTRVCHQLTLGNCDMFIFLCIMSGGLFWLKEQSDWIVMCDDIFCICLVKLSFALVLYEFRQIILLICLFTKFGKINCQQIEGNHFNM